MRSLFFLACLTLFTGSAFADDAVTYMRDRGHGGHGYHGGFGYDQHFYGNFYYPPPIYGSYYQRPYPTHLDYFRLRGTPMPDCPCAESMPPLPEVVPAE